jgi:hypothetical protein
MPGPKPVPLLLSDGERASLEALARKRTASQSLAERARIVLACAEESGVAPLTRVAASTGVSREMAGPVHGAADGWAGRRAAAGGAAQDH